VSGDDAGDGHGSGAAALFAQRHEAGDRAEGRLRSHFTARRTFCNPLGVVQGGLLMAMVELAMKDCVRDAAPAGTAVRLIDLQTSFLRAAVPGELICDATVTRLGRRTAFAAAQLRDPDDQVLATATGVLALQASG